MPAVRLQAVAVSDAHTYDHDIQDYEYFCYKLVLENGSTHVKQPPDFGVRKVILGPFRAATSRQHEILTV